MSLANLGVDGRVASMFALARGGASLMGRSSPLRSGLVQNNRQLGLGRVASDHHACLQGYCAVLGWQNGKGGVQDSYQRLVCIEFSIEAFSSNGEHVTYCMDMFLEDASSLACSLSLSLQGFSSRRQ